MKEFKDTIGHFEDESSFLEEETGKEYGLDYFNGNWRAKGYTCNRNTPKEETVKCEQLNDEKFKCTKTLGDDCVRTGDETFTGWYGRNRKDVVTGRSMSVVYRLGNASHPNSSSGGSNVKVIDDNTFRSGYGIMYYRIAPTPPPAPVAPAPLVVAQPAAIPAQRLVYYYTNYFLGNWNVIGYTCDDHTPQVEVVNVRYQGGKLHAVKLLGDNCVRTNDLTFRGNLPQTLWQGLTFPVEFVIGSPEHPAAAMRPENIQIVDVNTFRIGTHTYYRVMGPNAAHPHGVYINMTPMIGNSKFAGPGYVKLNPRRNMRTPVRRFVIVEEETNKPGNC